MNDWLLKKINVRTYYIKIKNQMEKIKMEKCEEWWRNVDRKCGNFTQQKWTINKYVLELMLDIKECYNPVKAFPMT